VLLNKTANPTYKKKPVGYKTCGGEGGEDILQDSLKEKHDSFNVKPGTQKDA
jgi:hypothetical protein